MTILTELFRMICRVQMGNKCGTKLYIDIMRFMKTKAIICLAVAMAAVGTGCEKSGLEMLPFLEKVDDVCTKMDDIEFMAYCYENFDVNDDGKVSMSEANAVRSIYSTNARTFAGIEYFSNMELFSASSVEEVDLRYNSKLKTLYLTGSVEAVDLKNNEELTSISITVCHNLKTVRLPEYLPNLSELDFHGCNSLVSIEIPNGITSIGGDSFMDCTSLVSVKIPRSVTYIGYRAFVDCDLTVVDAAECTNLQSVDYAFSSGSIKEFLLGTPIPPNVSWYNSSDSSPNTVLKVPAESIEAYENSNWAYHFSEIKPL